MSNGQNGGVITTTERTCTYSHVNIVTVSVTYRSEPMIYWKISSKNLRTIMGVTINDTSSKDYKGNF